MNEEIFKVEEFHRGEWQPLMSGKKQKIARITEEQAEILNKQSGYKNIRYVKEAKDVKDVILTTVDKTVDKTVEDTVEDIKVQYEEVLGKKPHHLKGIDSMKEEIAQAQK